MAAALDGDGGHTAHAAGTGAWRGEATSVGGELHRDGRDGRSQRAHEPAGGQAGTGRWLGAATGARLMFFPEGQIRVYLYGAPVDMRNSFDGLYALARHGLQQDPLNGQLFAF